MQSATYDESESKYVINGEPLSQCAILGEIVELEEKTAFLTLQLEDGTGKFQCKQWNNSNNANDGEDSAPSADHGLAVGMWVRVHVSLKEFNQNQQASVYGIRKEPFNGNFDAITHHYLQCIFEHLGRTKGTLGKLKNGGAGAGAASVKSPAAVYGQPDNFVAERAQGVKVESRGASGGDLLSTLKDIFAQQAPSEHGWSIDGIMDQLPAAGFGTATQQQVRVIVQALCDDGALYSTVDDDHWSSTA